MVYKIQYTIILWTLRIKEIDSKEKLPGFLQNGPDTNLKGIIPYVKYRDLLKIIDAEIEEVGQSVGIDLTSADFWQNSIDMIQEDIDLFEQLLNEVG